MLLVAASALVGCQSAAGPGASTQTAAERLASYVGSTLDVFERDATGVRPVSSRDTAEGRIFLYEGDPVIVMTTLPPYVPEPRRYSDPNLRAAANSLTAAVGAVPGVSRSTIQVCRVYILAIRVGEPPDPSSWRIQRAELEGAC